MRRTLKKLLLILLIILTLNNFFMTASFAEDNSNVNIVSAIGEKIQGLLNSIIGLLTLPVRAIAVGAAWGINLLTASVAYIEGTTEDANENVNISIITPFDIFFNRVKILDINFFDIGNDSSLVTQIRTSIAIWYYVLRNIAAAILLVILIYVGIRMALSTVATDKAMYKKMLFDWVASLVLIFVIQYIIIFAVSVNQSILKAIEAGAHSEEISNTYKVIMTLALNITDLDSIAATIIFCMLVWQTLGLVISYFNRMLKLAFLIIISPLITLTYSIDKMGDGKAQALGAWLREFVYTILIQPFHCIIYMCFVDVAFKLLIENAQGTDNGKTLGVAVVAILSVRFVKEAEKLIRKIFAFKDDNSSTSMTAGLAMAGVALSQSKNIGRGARNVFNGVRQTKGAISSAVTGAKIGALAIGAKIANPSKSLAEHKSEVRTDINNKKADKISEKATYKAKITTSAIEKEKKRIMEAMPGISSNEAQSIARLNVAKRVRNENGKVRKHITKAKGRINKIKDIASHSDTLKTVGTLAKVTMSSGMGLMVGSGLYGTNGNLMTSIAGGAAMFSGTQEFQRTAGTLEAGTVDNLKGLGVKDQMGAATEINRILMNSNLYDDGLESTEKMKELLDNIGKALEAAGIDSKYKTRIKNTIENGIKANPAQTSRIVRETLNGLNYEGKSDALNQNSSNIHLTGVANNSERTPLSEVNSGELLNATQDLADFINRKQIFQQIQTAGNFNIDADTYAGDVISKFDDIGDDYSDEIVDIGMEDVSTANEFEHNRINVDKETKGLTNGQLEELDREFEERKEEYRRQATNSNLSIDDKKAIDEIIRKLDQEQTDIMTRALADSDRELTTISSKLVEKYEEKLAEALAKAESELKDQEQGYSYRTKGYTKGNLNMAKARQNRLQKTNEMWKQNISNN